jgi:uncharacterized LabA/DUF88 family protein
VDAAAPAETTPPAPVSAVESVTAEPEEIVLPQTATPLTPSSEAVTLEAVDIEEDVAADAVVEPPAGDEFAASGANDRRGRRRRRGGRGNGVTHTEFTVPEAEPPAPNGYTANGSAPVSRRSQPAITPSRGYQDTSAPPAANPLPSPYGSPEPMHARGFGPTPRGVASEFRVQPSLARVSRNVDGGPPISANHLAAVITDAMQQQTDRLLAEQRRYGGSPAFTIAMPSTERVGVFVDVANLLYSSRSMRLPIDFGRLLTFLRGDRRLVRAHAYCPTSPEPYADQQFLQAVKGLGYRITTKDYKTFSSGAKKADLDLDLCMDIVRIVDADAVDSIVLVSGDSDFLPLLAYCADHGVRVEVAAFDESTAAILRQSCDLFINLSLVEEIRA